MTGAIQFSRGAVITGIAGLVIGLGGATLWQNRMIDQRIHDYVMAHPEIIPEAMKKLQARETSGMIDRNRAALERPYAGAWAGAATGDVTLVMFTDYSCGYCKSSVADVERLLAEDKRLKVVWREIPILGPGSVAAAHAALAAAAQGRYPTFHRRMFEAGPPSPESIAAVVAATGIRPADEAASTREIQSNLVLARSLGLTGTPTFVVGDQLLQGAVGYDALKKAVADARART